ncbi:MAG: metallophosphatase [Prevotella sp.]|jgi:5'-nucleotidase|nr:metallophosphatase [Prevotella sp.]MCH4018689.1 metallophosphatase [Prevotella sp.]MCH4100158.1 metallophosphatase [Prevotella sp.]MCI1324150.1 metallophosphatase [Prevotella sp.]MCI1415095.1 metallophosphatase [Prevotella sp.]
MKKSFYFLLFVLLLSLSPLYAHKKELIILHTNDVHSCIMPLSKNLADTFWANRGGFFRCVSMVKQQRTIHPDLLLFDSGDFSQGSPYYTLFKGDVEIGLMNIMHYDAAVIGNHEFDFGLDNMARIFKEAHFPILCANYDFTGTPVQGLVKPWIILHRKGLKIGVFGVSPHLKGLVDDRKCVGVKFLDPVKTALRVATYLKKKKKCDLVICLSHLGWDIHDAQDDENLIQGTRYIDLVLGGHSHSFFKTLEHATNLDGVSVPDDQNGKSAIYVGDLTLDFVKK